MEGQPSPHSDQERPEDDANYPDVNYHDDDYPDYPDNQGNGRPFGCYILLISARFLQ